MAVNHKVGQPLPDGEYEPDFIAFLEGSRFWHLKHESNSINVGEHIFAGSNWIGEGLGAAIIAELPSGPASVFMEDMVSRRK